MDRTVKKHIDRRAIIKGAAITTAAGVVAASTLRATIAPAVAAATAAEADPLLALHDAFRAQEAVVLADDTVDEDRFGEKVDKLSAIKREIAAMPARSQAGFAIKLDIAERELLELWGPCDGDPPDLATVLMLSVFRDARRLLVGAA